MRAMVYGTDGGVGATGLVVMEADKGDAAVYERRPRVNPRRVVANTRHPRV